MVFTDWLYGNQQGESKKGAVISDLHIWEGMRAHIALTPFKGEPCICQVL